MVRIISQASSSDDAWLPTEFYQIYASILWCKIGSTAKRESRFFNPLNIVNPFFNPLNIVGIPKIMARP